MFIPKSLLEWKDSTEESLLIFVPVFSLCMFKFFLTHHTSQHPVLQLCWMSFSCSHGEGSQWGEKYSENNEKNSWQNVWYSLKIPGKTVGTYYMCACWQTSAVRDPTDCAARLDILNVYRSLGIILQNSQALMQESWRIKKNSDCNPHCLPRLCSPGQVLRTLHLPVTMLTLLFHYTIVKKSHKQEKVGSGWTNSYQKGSNHTKAHFLHCSAIKYLSSLILNFCFIYGSYVDVQ